MYAAAFVIPLAAMAVPIVLILLAVLIDALVLGWFAFRMWHDEWAPRIAAFIGRVIAPIRELHSPGRPTPRLR